jgi:hypothetical protein
MSLLSIDGIDVFSTGTVVWPAMIFGGFLHQSNYDRKKLRPEKKGTVVWLTVEINLR